MAKVYPHTLSSSTSSKQEVFTVWMKSLILHSHGCTVFNSSGRVVYRVDNYNHKCSSQVFLMDITGKVLFTIVKKKFTVLGRWEGYRVTGTDKRKPGFRVRKKLGILGAYTHLEVVVGLDVNQPCQYTMENQSCKSSCKIIDNFGGLVAEVKRKITTSGVILGEDVLTMVVEPYMDHSLVMGLLLVFGLINNKL
ncbi:LURP-one-related 11-like [Olea europaea subsp. europaea]|uniref:LURP-one-related 11-like n=1 Tax=Olea europaea subsp. europaea TaxID=158383 RepID=A0A8S0U6R4_OLEEU|nr:LURP-one-related 11-like [Olea europaea subsp. europaea]CAA3012448.1 LURP-one-related 11-like [Olea europaea subsp. europaea]